MCGQGSIYSPSFVQILFVFNVRHIFVDLLVLQNQSQVPKIRGTRKTGSCIRDERLSVGTADATNSVFVFDCVPAACPFRTRIPASCYAGRLAVSPTQGSIRRWRRIGHTVRSATARNTSISMLQHLDTNYTYALRSVGPVDK